MEINSEPDLIRSAVAGVSDSVIENIKESIPDFIQKFLAGDLAFIQERETIDRVREQLKSNEHKFYKTYIKDDTYQTMVALGLTMRKLDSEEDTERRLGLIKKINNNYGKEKLHLAYLVQNKTLAKCITLLLENIEDDDLFTKTLEEFLIDIEKHVYFVRNSQSPEQIADTIKRKVDSFSPKIFVISGTKSAKKNVDTSFEIVRDFIEELYDIEEWTGSAKVYLMNNFQKEFVLEG